MSIEVLYSAIDPSTNFVNKIGPGEALEARYVRRHKDYLACYLSCQTGCEQSCRFCHLTFTGQNKARDATVSEILEQAKLVLRYYKESQPPANVVHYNFMARGEPMSSSAILEHSQELFTGLDYLASLYDLFPRFLISTIMPEEANVELTSLFRTIHPEIYYSLYSMDPSFRRRWLPRAMDPNRALDLLTNWQRQTKKIIRIHYALIKGENDREEDASQIIEAVKGRGLRADFTFVRYNPPSPRHGEESDRYGEYKSWLESSLEGVRVKVIDRVGYDVAASCGMFVNTK